jgi:hypothetical protein
MVTSIRTGSMQHRGSGAGHAQTRLRIPAPAKIFFAAWNCQPMLTLVIAKVIAQAGSP